MTAYISTYDLVFAVVARIPKGRVATYGQIARLAGLPRHARLVGYALHALPERSHLPWHRVVNAEGRISLRSDGLGHDRLQRVLLEREGVRFNKQGVVPLNQFQWCPKTLTSSRRPHST
jgi:methylated-DNA-protein-cysteine methyltransferase related protein